MQLLNYRWPVLNFPSAGYIYILYNLSHAIAGFPQWRPRFEPRSGHVEFVVDKVALGQVLWFPLPIFIPPIAPQSPSSTIRGWFNGPVVATVASGLSLTPLRIKKYYITSI
jgi:hypothetical protein